MYQSRPRGRKIYDHCDLALLRPKMSKLTDIINLSVGGQEFKTTRSTLVADQNSRLAKIFEIAADSTLLPAVANDEKGVYFFDRDHKYFNIVLNFLRTGAVEVTESIDLNCLLLEAQYYGIKGMIDNIRQAIKAQKYEEEEKTMGKIFHLA